MRLRFGPFENLGLVLERRNAIVDFVGIPGESEAAQQAAAIFSRGRLANHSEQPGLQARFAAKPGFAFKDLQVDGLEDFFRLSRVAAATTQGPAETSAVQSLQLSLKIRDFHRVNLHGKAPCSLD